MRLITILLKGLIIGLASILLFSCQNREPDVNGKTIIGIQREKLVFEDGTELPLELESQDQIIYLIRHAEKDSLPPNDPVLSSQGNERAARLANIFLGSRIDAMYSTMYTRTIMTLDSLSRLKGMSIKPYDARNLKDFIEIIDNDTVHQIQLIVGHSNTTPPLVKYFAEMDTIYHIQEDQYDDFFMIVKKNGESKLLKLKY